MCPIMTFQIEPQMKCSIAARHTAGKPPLMFAMDVSAWRADQLVFCRLVYEVHVSGQAYFRSHFLRKFSEHRRHVKTHGEDALGLIFGSVWPVVSNVGSESGGLISLDSVLS